MRPALRGHQVAEALERAALGVEVVRPQGGVLLAHVDPPEQVVETPQDGAAVGRFAVERIAFEVEEDVALVGARHRTEAHRIHDLVERRVAPIALRGELQSGLRAQSRERLGVHAIGTLLCRGERVDRHDAG